MAARQWHLSLTQAMMIFALAAGCNRSTPPQKTGEKRGQETARLRNGGQEPFLAGGMVLGWFGSVFLFRVRPGDRCGWGRPRGVH